jgi:hypothetical protein
MDQLGLVQLFTDSALSYLSRLVVLSARREDSQGLEDFLMRESFINDQLAHVDPNQANDLQERR